MKYLMLRGQVPKDRNPQEIVFDSIDACDDVWTRLLYNMINEGDHGEIWYWGGKREHKFADNFTERWIPSFNDYRGKFVPDVIFCRGGFEEYHSILRRFPKAFKIYHGAGRRYLPLPSFTDYGLILYDLPSGIEEGRKKFPNSKHHMLLKGAPENLFYPIEDVQIEYDVCFPANGTQAKLKGHSFVYSTVPRGIRVLNLGNKSRIHCPKNVISYRVLKSDMPKEIAKCKIGIVTLNNFSGLPRVLPELIACGKPVVLLNGAGIWKEKYILSAFDGNNIYPTGECADKNDFWETVCFVLDNLDLYKPREYYLNNLTMAHCVDYIRKALYEVGI